jgi:prepilin-type N-terminal cleavage/methylation domain-containing protein
MRRAFTLIEMLVTVSIGAVLMSIAISLLMALSEAEQGGRTHVEQNRAIQRLADQFRRDAHAAEDVVVDGSSPKEWQLKLTGNEVARYAVKGDDLAREERTGTKVIRRESYQLPKDSTAAIAVDRVANPPIVSLTLVPNDASTQSDREIRIDAVLGRDRRFAEQRKEEK